MRTNIVHIGAEELSYEIREIVEVARQLEKITGRETLWENIGDPVQKGEKIPEWIKDIVAAAVREDSTYGYCPTRGLLETREFLAERLNARGGVQITPEDIIFFNGLGDAVSKVYGMLRRTARVIGPSPAYPTHSSAEAAHAGSPPITYRLDPSNGWMPDLEELRMKVKYNESIGGIMVTNPDNPTGTVFPAEVLKEMVSIAREFDLFLVADEIYQNMVYNGHDVTPLSAVIEDVPALSLKGISKEIPWPGGRCGWIEVYNHVGQPIFEKYVKSILDAKMLEVCSTTLPQYVIPRIFAHPEYARWQTERNAGLAERSRLIDEIFKDTEGIAVNPPSGAFYCSVVFQRPLDDSMHLHIENEEARALIERLCPPGTPPDKRFVYQLLAAYGICVVPLTSFVCDLPGFRATTLEQDRDRFVHIFKTIAHATQEFLGVRPALQAAQ